MKKRSKITWKWIVDSFLGKKKLTRKTRTNMATVAGIGSFILCVLVFTRAHKETQIQFEESEARTEAIQALLDSNDFGYAIMDQRGQIIEWNPALERLTHWTQKEVKEKGLGILMDDKSIFERHLKAVANSMGKESLDGKVAVVSCVISPHDESLKPLPVRVTVRTVQSKKGKRFAIAHIDKESAVKEVSP